MIAQRIERSLQSNQENFKHENWSIWTQSVPFLWLDVIMWLYWFMQLVLDRFRNFPKSPKLEAEHIESDLVSTMLILHSQIRSRTYREWSRINHADLLTFPNSSRDLLSDLVSTNTTRCATAGSSIQGSRQEIKIHRKRCLSSWMVLTNFWDEGLQVATASVVAPL